MVKLHNGLNIFGNNSEWKYEVFTSFSACSACCCRCGDMTDSENKLQGTRLRNESLPDGLTWRCYTVSHPDWLSDRVDNLVPSLSVTGHPPHVAHSSPGRKGRKGREEKNREGKTAAPTLKTPTSAGSISRIVKHQRHAGWQRQVWPETPSS